MKSMSASPPRSIKQASEHKPFPRSTNLLRLLPIRGRILSIGALNTAVVLLLTILVLDGAKQLNAAWSELLQVRRSDQILTSIETEASRLQSLIHRYFTQPNQDVLTEIEMRRRTLAATLAADANLHPSLANSTQSLARITDKLVAAFDELREVRASTSILYEDDVLKTAREISGLYAIVESSLRGADSLVRPSLGKSREAFSSALLNVNAYYLSLSANSAQEAFSALDTIEATIPVMSDLAENDLQRAALAAIRLRVVNLRQSLLKLSAAFDRQATLLRDSVDRSQAEMTGATTSLAAVVQQREMDVQGRLDSALSDIYKQVAAVSIAALALIALFGTAIARSISTPLSGLINSMSAIMRGDLDAKISGLHARDEIGAMARAIEVFRDDAKAKVKAEEELLAAKENAERAFAELRDTQRSLIEAEKLAALGGLVAGVAHEVNNPVGISLTVASSLSRRTTQFAAELASGAIRRSRLEEFIIDTRDAANQLEANLHRAGDLIQSFKQVAVDRSYAERRSFDLAHATEQIIASLRPELSKRHLSIHVECPPDIKMDSFPGAYGQVLTNLSLNASTHAFKTKTSGGIRIRATEIEGAMIQIDVADDGDGMSDDVRRQAFEPFFTTRRGQGGTGLGLHIVFNIVTQQLGGRIKLTTRLGEGSMFRIVIPRSAPERDAGDETWMQSGTNLNG
jgi:signal transduction histidine kinase